MPRAAKKSKRRQRKSTRARRASRRTPRLNSGPHTGISSRVMTCLKYHSRIPLNITAAVPSDYQFRLNSLFDPDYTGAGHQPAYFDQLSTIYSKYRVFAASWVIKLITSDSVSVETVVIPTNSTTAISTVDLAGEMPRSQYKQWNNYNPTTFKGRVNLPSLTGVTSTQYKSDDRYFADYNANPAEILNLHLTNISGSSATVIADVTLKFHCEFFDPFDISQS